MQTELRVDPLGHHEWVPPALRDPSRTWEPDDRWMIAEISAPAGRTLVRFIRAYLTGHERLAVERVLLDGRSAHEVALALGGDFRDVEMTERLIERGLEALDRALASAAGQPEPDELSRLK